MRISFKESARFAANALTCGVIGGMIRALDVTAPSLIDDVVVITSANDSKHGPNSLHYRNRAIDVRFLGIRPGGIAVPVGTPEKDVAELQKLEALTWKRRLAAELGRGFDVVLESDHLHLEHDPK